MNERCNDHSKFEDRLFSTMNDLTSISKTISRLEEKIDNSIKSIEDHIKSGGTWRGIIATVAISLIMHTIFVAYMYGQLCNTVKINGERIVALEDLHPRSDNGK